MQISAITIKKVAVLSILITNLEEHVKSLLD